MWNSDGECWNMSCWLPKHGYNMTWWTLLTLAAVLCLPVTTGGTECSQAVFGHHGVIESYNYPFNYRHNLSCTYRIVLGPSDGTTRTVCFTFHRFSLEQSTPFCSYDFVRFDLVKYCGNGLWQYGRDTPSPESNVWHRNFCWPAKKDHFDVTFKSDNNLNGGGFYATYDVHPGPPPSAIDETHIGKAPCESNRWTCFNRKCINSSLVCDGKDDCGDGSDETYAHARCPDKSLLACDFSADNGFSDGQCGFVQQGGQWFRTNTRATPDGPSGDHTNATHGFYLYTDGDHSPAYLVSPEMTLPPSADHCLTFWYYVYGRPAAAQLRVFLGRQTTYTRPEWGRSSTAETNKWLRGQVLVQTDTPLQVTFGASFDNNFSGLALDDISVQPGACRQGDISCNFESTLCGWSAEPKVSSLSGTLTWARHNRLKSAMGPLQDHSSQDGSGLYAFLRADPGRPRLDSRGLLLSPYVSAFWKSTFCVRFWYHMSGSGYDSAILRARVKRTASSEPLSAAVWSQNARFQNSWRQVALQLEENNPFQILLEGVLDGATGQIAIDQLELADGACPEVDSGACAGGEYLCGDGNCIPSQHKCDGMTHCLDGSDEDWRAACPSIARSTTVATSTVCPLSHYRCQADGKCVPNTWVCDNFRDCADGSDENHLAGCSGLASEAGRRTTTSICNSEQYACASGQCVALFERCDGVADCHDGSDEGPAANCTYKPGVSTTSHPPCAPSEHTCVTDRRCVRLDQLCDGHTDCDDGSDEDSTVVQCAKPINTTGIGTSAAVGIALALLVVLIGIILLYVIVCRRRKARLQRGRSNRPGTPDTPTPDVSTISYGDDTSLSRPLEDSLRVSAHRPARRLINPINEFQRQIDHLQGLEESRRQASIDRLQNFVYDPHRRTMPLPPPPPDLDDDTDPDPGIHSMPVRPPPYSRQNYQNLQCVPPDGDTSEHARTVAAVADLDLDLPPDEPPPPYDAINKDAVVIGNTLILSQQQQSQLQQHHPQTQRQQHLQRQQGVVEDPTQQQLATPQQQVRHREFDSQGHQEGQLQGHPSLSEVATDGPQEDHYQTLQHHQEDLPEHQPPQHQLHQPHQPQQHQPHQLLPQLHQTPPHEPQARQPQPHRAQLYQVPQHQQQLHQTSQHELPIHPASQHLHQTPQHPQHLHQTPPHHLHQTPQRQQQLHQTPQHQPLRQAPQNQQHPQQVTQQHQLHQPQPYQVPQHQVPQHQVPQHQVPQHQVPQHQVPQHQVPQHSPQPQHLAPLNQQPYHQVALHQPHQLHQLPKHLHPPYQTHQQQIHQPLHEYQQVQDELSLQLQQRRSPPPHIYLHSSSV